MTLFSVSCVVIAGYLLGSIPWAVLIGRFRGVDVLAGGSGNPGATNVMRTVGRTAGILCFLLDAGKGALAAGWPLVGFAGEAVSLELAIAGLAAAIIGHSYSVFIRFRGGKAVATTIGGLLVLTPSVMGIALVVWAVVFASSRYVAVASLALGFSLPLAAWILGEPASIRLVCLALAVLIWLRHRSNIDRLRQGTEHRFARRPDSRLTNPRL